MAAPLSQRIVVDGNDGTGKSTLVTALRQLGFSQVDDRGELTRATDDDSLGPAPGTRYLLLVCPPETSLARLSAAGADLADPYHQPSALAHYDHRFRALAARFGATVIDTATTAPHEVLAEALTALCEGPLRVGLPKGRLPEEEAGALLAPLAPFDVPPPAPRTLVWSAGPLLVLRGRTKVYPKLVAFAELDLAVCGSDVLDACPFAPQVEVVARARQPGVRLVLASADGTLPEKPLLRVATEQREVAQRYLSRRGIPHTIFELSGSAEGFVPRFADVVIDIVETGQTLRDNGLVVVEELGPLDVCLIRRRSA